MTNFSNIDDFVTDPKIEKQGVDLDFGNGRFITIRRAGGANVEFKNRLANLIEDRTNTVTGLKTDSDDDKDILYQLFAKYIVIDWKGWKDSNGNEIPFSVQSCIELFECSEEIYSHVNVQSMKLDNFRTKQVLESGNE